MLQRLGIRGKLLAVVAVPTIVLLFAAAFVVWNATAAFSTARNTAQLIDLAGNSAPLVDQLQAERANASNYLRATTDGSSKRLNARTDTNRSLAAIAQAAEGNPALAGLADQVAVMTAGSTTDRSLEDTRSVAVVDTVNGEFPAWASADDISASVLDFERMATNIEALAPQAPTAEFAALIATAGASLRAEAEATKTFLTEAALYSSALPENFTAVDRALAKYNSAARAISGRSENAPIRALLGDIGNELKNLEDLRLRVKAGTIVPSSAENDYTDVINDLITMTRTISNTVPNRDLAAYLGAYSSMQEMFEAVRLEQEYVERETRQGFYLTGEYRTLQSLYFKSNNARDNAELAVEPLRDITPVPEFGASFSQINGLGFEVIRDALINDPSPEVLLAQRETEWDTQVKEELAVMDPIRAEIFAVVTNQSAELERTSLIQTLATIVGAGVIIAASLFITFGIARRIVNPLRRLTTTATAVRQELPRLVERVAMPGQTVDVSEVQIPVESRDEVGRLAEAFNSINAATLSIAAEQAALRGSISEMFVNVARRDQVLLNRQLASIDEMERTEDNQETLTKLFALDHLATRMRRNSESLLVLAGIDTGRRLRRAMPLSDVIRTASSEIELYERVQLELDADPSMLGHSALTAAHLFAELLENATVFSDPGSPVIVRTMERDGAFVVTVSDSGIGMTPEELGEANSRVASTAASEILGAQRLGLFVVGRIARRVGARVHLESGEAKGTVATVVMPPSMFDMNTAYPQGHQSSTVADATTHAPAALMHHDTENEVIETPAAPARSLAAYQPTVIEGAPLGGGRAPEQAPEPEPAAPQFDQAPAVSAEISSLVAADAASAPTAVPFDLEEYTEGATAAGLPTRRRKAPAGSEAKQDTHSIIALPQRASAEQLSALESAATTGFTPILAAEDVSPESAEARSRVFRGFRPLRAAGADAAEFAPDGESLGHAVRRGAPVEEASAESASIPVLEFEALDVQQDEPVAEVSLATEPVALAPDEPVAAAIEEPRAVEKATYAVEAADPRDQIDAVVHQSPLISTGYVGDDVLASPPAGTDLAAAAALLVPQLEDDDEPRPALPVSHYREPERQGADWSTPGGTAGVESVSLEDLPIPAPVAQVAPMAPVAQAAPIAPASLMPQAEQPAPVYRSPLYPAVAAPAAWQQPAEPQFEPDPVTSSPSLDDLIMDGSRGHGDDERTGFFARVFGKGRKGSGDDGRGPSRAAPMPSEAVGPPTGSVPTPAPSWSVPAPDPVAPQEAPATPSGAWNTAPAAQASGAVYAAPAAEQWGQPTAGYEPTPSYGVPAAQAHTPTAPYGAPAPASVPVPYVDPTPSYGAPAGGFEPIAPSFAPPAQQDSLPGEPWRDAAPSAPAWNTAPSAPLAPDFGVAPTLFGNQEQAPTYSPDQLARPMGWEAAGASALQAAAPEVATEYRPVVQINPEPLAAGETDFASAVFSELSSLAAERPKVEKTRAGLAKRTPVPVEEPQVIDPHVVIPSVPRDAEAVRTRFSAFYSGTQRARDDVQNFNDSTQGSLTES